MFEKHKISDTIRKRIMNNSYKENNNILLNELSYLKLDYLGFDNKVHTGEMIVNEKIADEVIEIFKELLDKRFLIDKIRLIDEYDANDFLSIENNNTSAFCYRVIENTTRLSRHAYGYAIDINPLQNPYVYEDGTTVHKKSEKYLYREKVKKGMIIKNDDCYLAFKKKGWEWGGDWIGVKDYQHFQKK